MSFVLVTSPALALSPKVWFVDGCLHARTSLLSQVLMLGFAGRTVVADSKRRMLTITSRFFWILESKTELRFDEISHFDYRFGSLATSWDLWGKVHDSLESYSITAVRKNRTEEHVLSFRGEGSASTGLAGVILGSDDPIDYEGDQGASSLGYLESLQSITRKGLGRPSFL
jgi:hypothetical protein